MRKPATVSKQVSSSRHAQIERRSNLTHPMFDVANRASLVGWRRNRETAPLRPYCVKALIDAFSLIVITLSTAALP